MSQYVPFRDAATLDEESINGLFTGAADVASAIPYKIDCGVVRRVRVWCEQIIPDCIQLVRVSKDVAEVKRLNNLCVRQYAALRQKVGGPILQQRLLYAVMDLRHAIYEQITKIEVNNNGK